MNKQKECPTMEAAEVATLLGLSRGHFSRIKKDLIANDGLPAPLPGRRYSRKAIMSWIESYGARKSQATAKSIASLNVSWDRAKLEATYLGRAA